ncbi:MAG TPA: hypothetical protein VF881_08730 [Polyangiaceae bacterium]
MRDVLLVGGLVLAFATLVTVHVAIVFGLAKEQPRWRAAVAFFVPPLAPYWALRGGMKVRGGIWIGSVILYSALLGVAAL